MTGDAGGTPEPSRYWPEQLVKAIPLAHPLAKAVIGEVAETGGNPGHLLHVDTGLESVAVTCTIVPSKSQSDGALIFIGQKRIGRVFENPIEREDEDTLEDADELEDRKRLLVAERLLELLAGLYFFEKLQANESSAFKVTRARVSGVYGERGRIQYIVTTPNRQYRTLLCLSQGEYEIVLDAPKHSLLRDDLKSNQLPHRLVIDAIGEYEWDHRIAILPLLKDYLIEKKFVLEIDDGDESSSRVTVDLGHGWKPFFIVCAKTIQWALRHYPTTTCHPDFPKYIKLMQAVDGLTFEKLRNWSLKTKLTEPEVTQAVIVEGDYV